MEEAVHGFFQSMFDNFTGTLTTAMTNIANTMSSQLSAPLTAAMTIYIVLYGFSIMRGTIQEPIMDFVFRGMKLVVIWTLVTKSGDYASWVGSTITIGLPEFVSNITGGDTSRIPSDPIMAMATNIGIEVQDKYGSGIAGSIWGYILSFAVTASAMPLAGIAFVLSAVVLFGLGLLAAVGPLFVAFALFEFSRGWFFSWLGQILNFALLQMLVITLMQVISRFVADLGLKLGNIGDDGTSAAASAMGFIAAMLTAFMFFFLLPSIAAALASGAQGSTGALQRYAERKLFGGKNNNDNNKDKGANGSSRRTS